MVSAFFLAAVLAVGSAAAPTPENLQDFNGALGGIYAPAVYTTGNKWTTNGQVFNSALEALERSCYVQLDQCQLAANKGGNKPPLTVAFCNNQLQPCLVQARTHKDKTSSTSTSASSTASSSASSTSSTSSTSSASSTASATPSAVCSSAPRAAGDLQTFTGALGCLPAPPVSVSGDKWTTNNLLFNFPQEATQRSCYVQLDNCQLAANRGNNKEPLTVANCNTQVQACLASATAPASSSAASTSSATSTSSASSTASATPSAVCSSAPRAAGDLQTFTGALGCLPAPPVSVSGDKWTTNNLLFNFPQEATQRSCYVQLDNCQLAANRGNNKEPLTVANCNTQVQACLASATASSTATSSTTLSPPTTTTTTTITTTTEETGSSTTAPGPASSSSDSTPPPHVGPGQPSSEEKTPTTPTIPGNLPPDLAPEQAAPSGLRRRAVPRPQTVHEYYCMKGLTACAIPRTSDWECVDPMADIESCGGCAYGNFGGDTAPMGVDCTQLPGVKSTGVTCRVGQCVVTACKRGWTLMGGSCVRN